jgi:hypothetical protein
MNLHISLHKMEGAFGHAGSAQNGVSHSSSHGVFNETMPLVPVQSGAVIGGVAGPATNLYIGMDYWGATGSSPVPAMRGKVASGSARGEQWVCKQDAAHHCRIPGGPDDDLPARQTRRRH